MPFSRRSLLRAAGAAAFSGLGGTLPAELDAAPGPRAEPPRDGKPRKTVAAVVTAYFPLSHAYHIVGRFLHGYLKHGQLYHPDYRGVSLYVDKPGGRDVHRELAERFGFRIYPSVAETLENGTGKLAVDAVLLIGEHGNYPFNEKGQQLYPRYELFQKIVEVFRKSGRSVPVYNDKHLSYDWEHAREMVATAKEMGFGLMAASSLPVTWRRPELEFPLGVELQEALVAGYGPADAYGFHALETLQCMVERRKGGESGVAAITCLEGNAVWEAGDRGTWSWDLLEAALGRSETLNVGDARGNCRNPVAFVIEYRDGLRATALLLNNHIADFNFAGRVKGTSKPASALFYLPAPPGANYFSALADNIEKLFKTGRSPYPIERTLLTTGILAFAMESRFRGNRRLATSQLDMRYQAPADSGFWRGGVANPV
jgi:hypothetical protein